MLPDYHNRTVWGQVKIEAQVIGIHWLATAPDASSKSLIQSAMRHACTKESKA